MKRSRLWFVSQSAKKEPWSEKSFPGKGWSSYVSGGEKKLLSLLEENMSQNQSAVERKAEIKQAQRTMWATKEKGKRKARHWRSAPGSQSCTMNLPSQFTSHFSLFSLGQSFWEMGCSAWDQEGSSLLCLGHPPVIPRVRSTEGCRCAPRCTRSPFGHLNISAWGCHTPT